jgi:hypothetical protein
MVDIQETRGDRSRYIGSSDEIHGPVRLSGGHSITLEAERSRIVPTVTNAIVHAAT